MAEGVAFDDGKSSLHNAKAVVGEKGGLGGLEPPTFLEEHEYRTQTLVLHHLQANCIIGSSARNFHIGFDPDNEIIKNTRLVYNETRIV